MIKRYRVGEINFDKLSFYMSLNFFAVNMIIVIINTKLCGTTYYVHRFTKSY